MAVKLNEMKARTKTLVVDWDGEKVDVSYFPNAVTPELLDRVDDAVAANDRNVLGVLLVPVIEWWDILEDDNSRMPVSDDNIQRVPMSFLNKLQDSIQEAQRPPESSSSAAS